MFSMNNVKFFDTEGHTIEKDIEDFNKAVLRGDIISDEVWKFVYYNDIIEVVDTIEHSDKAGRWDYSVDVVFELEGTCFYFSYYRGLTECQENEFIDMKAVPVHKVVKTITVKEWERVDN